MATEQIGLSRQLLTRVLSVYFFLTFLVTAGQVFTEYLSTKSHIESELQTLKNTFSSSLTQAIWEVNIPQAESIALGLMELPIVTGVQIRDEHGEYIANLGATIQQRRALMTNGQLKDHKSGIFSYSFPLVFEFSNRTSNLGDVTLYSSFDIIFGRIEIGVFFLLGNALVKTAFLVFLFMTAFRKMLSEPLLAITQQMETFNLDHPSESKITLTLEDENELRLLQNSYNRIIDDLMLSQRELKNTRGELEKVNRKLDDQNLLLEREVAKKTASLSQIMLDLEQQKDELIANQRELRQENENRQYIESILREKNQALATSMANLQIAQDQLLESERMASLGGLVAGIAHDVNTPIGVGVTAASFLDDRIKTIKQAYTDKTLSKKMMNAFISETEQTTQLLLTNLNRASELIASFKQVAVDQTSEAERVFNLSQYLNEILLSLAPSYKKQQPTINVSCPETLEIRTAPGIIAQVITNMIMNSLLHGFENMQHGTITINISVENNIVCLTYQDDGCGLDPEALASLFDAFYTTKRGKGGSGLGTHIMYNLVTQALGGTIKAQSELGKGLRYDVSFPTYL